MPIRPSAPPVAGNARRLHASRRNSPESSDCPARRPFARPIFFGGPTTIVILSFGLAPFFRIRQQRVENTPMRPTPEASDRPDRDGVCERRVRIAVARGAESRRGGSLDRSCSAPPSQSPFLPLSLPGFDCNLRFLVLTCFRQLLLKHFGIVKPTVKV